MAKKKVTVFENGKFVEKEIEYRVERPRVEELEKVTISPVVGYKKYLPTAFSNQITMVEKLNQEIETTNKILESINGIIENQNVLNDKVQDLTIDISGELVAEILPLVQESLSADLVRLQSEVDVLEGQLANKMDKSVGTTMQADINTLKTSKADKAEIVNLQNQLSGKADINSVSDKADVSQVLALEVALETKADKTSLERLEEEVSNIPTDSNLQELRGRVDVIETVLPDKANQVDLTNLDTRVTAVETVNTTQTANIAQLRTDVNSKANQSALNTTNTNVTNLTATVNTKANQSEVTTLAGTVANHTTQIGSKADKTTVTALTSTVNANNTAQTLALETWKENNILKGANRVDLAEYLQNGWVSFGSSGSSVPRSYKLDNAMGMIFGGIKHTGTVDWSLPVLTLPEGFKPTFSFQFPIMGDNVDYRYKARLGTDGSLIITPATGVTSSAHVRLEGIIFSYFLT